ncbi:hypothetical protein HOD84_09960 [bacterium]|nr:hypothetical protein [bacterium]
MKFLVISSLIQYMVNIQIRGNLIEVVLEKLSANKISKLQKTATPQISLLRDIEKQKINTHNNIYRNILPVIDDSLELQVSSFDNDNYYDDGYTFFRSNLDNIGHQDKNITILLEKIDIEYFLIKLNYGYGAGFETEIIDLDYKSFETDKLNFNSTFLFEKYNQVLHSLSLNYLNFEDLGRNKFEILRTEILLVKSSKKLKRLDLSTKISNQVKVVDTISYS